LSRYMTYNLSQILFSSGKQLTLHDLANLFWITRGLIESLGEEQLKSKKRNKLTELTRRFESLVFVQATISHILVTINRDKAKLTAQQFNFDLPLYQHQLVTLFEQHDKAGGALLSEQLQQFLSKVDQTTAYLNVGNSELRNFIAYVNALNHLALNIPSK